MEKKSFFQTKAGGLTIAFIVVVIAFVIGLTGVNADNDGMCMAAFILIIGAMLYSPLKVYIYDCITKKKRG